MPSPDRATGDSVSSIVVTDELAAAAEAGVDVALLIANLALTPAQRIEELVEMNRLHEAIQARTLSPALRRRLEETEIEELRLRLGPLCPEFGE